MQHLSVKIFAQPGAELNSADAIAVFHRWIQHGDSPEMLIDVADYAHVPAGPGVVLMGLQAAYSLDSRHNRLGLLYNRRESTGSLRQNYETALAACRRLESEPEFKDKLRFDANEFALIWNDRLLFPTMTSPGKKCARASPYSWMRYLGRTRTRWPGIAIYANV